MVSRNAHIKNKTFKKLFEKIIKEELPEQLCDVAVLFSGGVDSSTCLFALLELGYNPIIYSFRLSNYISEDFLSAKNCANLFNLKFKEVIVPTNNIKQDFLKLVQKYNCSKKTQLECAFPWMYLFQEISEEYVITGLCADSHYGLSKTVMINYKDTKEKFDKYRISSFEKGNPEGIKQMEHISKEYNKILISPYVHPLIQKYFLQFNWEEINKPYQKYLIIQNYNNYFKKTGRRIHSNLQLNARIPEVFITLLDDKEFNFKNRKRTMDLVRDYYKKYND